MGCMVSGLIIPCKDGGGPAFLVMVVGDIAVWATGG